MMLRNPCLSLFCIVLCGFHFSLFAGGNDNESSIRDPDALLLQAIDASDLSLAREAVDQGANPNTLDESGKPLLVRALYALEEDDGIYPVVRFLFMHFGGEGTPEALRIDVNTRNEGGSTILHEAVLEHDDELIVFLLAQGADVNALCEGGNTPLYLSFLNNVPSIMGLLVEAGGRVIPAGGEAPSILNEHRQTQAFFDAAQALGFAFRNADGSARMTPLHLTTLFDGSNDCNSATAILRLNHLLQLESDLEQRLFHSNLLEVMGDRIPEEVRSSLRSRSATGSSEERGYTLLYLALLVGDARKAMLMVQAGANPYAICEDGLSPLGLAQETGQEIFVQYLNRQRVSMHRAAFDGRLEDLRRNVAEHELDINGRNAEGLTPLHIAAMQGHNEAVQLLLEMGADFSKEDNQNRTALELAVGEGQAAVALIIWHFVFAWAIEHSDANSINLAVGAGVNINAPLPSPYPGTYPLSRASFLGEYHIVELLLESGALPNIEGAPECSQPLDCALMGWVQSRAQHNLYEDDEQNLYVCNYSKYEQFPKRYHETLIRLINAGARIEFRHLKVVMENFDDPRAHTLFGEMIEHNASLLNAIPPLDVNPRTPLLGVALLQKKHYKELVAILVSRGVKMDCGADFDGYHPIHIAAIVGDLTFLKFAIESGADVNRRGPRGATALSLAARNGDEDMVRALLALKALYIDDGTSPLHGLVWGAYESAFGVGATYEYEIDGARRFTIVARDLVQAGASLSARDEQGRTPYELARQIDRKGVIDEALIDILRGVERPTEGLGLLEDSMDIAIDVGGDVRLEGGDSIAMPSDIGINRES